MIRENGPTRQVVERYLNDGLSSANLVWMGEHKDNDFLRIDRIQIVDQGLNSGELYLNEDIQVEISVDVFKDVTGIAFEIFVQTIEGIVAFCSFTDTMTLLKGRAVAACLIPKNLMNNGRYGITVVISKNYSYFLVRIDEAITIELLGVADGPGWQGEWPGVVRPLLNWNVRQDRGQDSALQLLETAESTTATS